MHLFYKAVLIFGGGTALLFLFSFIHIQQGSVDITLSIIMEAIFGNGEELEHEIIRTLRLPRIVVGIMAGAALASAGVLFQTLTKNPLASPATLGVNAGAYLLVILGAVFLPASLPVNGFVLAFAGGAIAAVLVFLISGGSQATPVRMALAGMVLTLTFSAFTSAIQIFFEYETAGLFLWGNGTLVQNDWSGAQFMVPATLTLLAILLLFSKKFDVLFIGEEHAKGLGENVTFIRVSMFLGAVTLTAISVSVVGPIGFIGLIAPHIIRLMGLYLHGWLLSASMLWGAVIVIGADMAGRWLDPSLNELPVGSVTALIGAPWLIWLIWKHRGTFFRLSRKEGLSGSGSGKKVSYSIVMIGAIIFTVTAVVFGISVGSQGLELQNTWLALINSEETALRSFIIDLRLSRVLVALVTGMLLAISGLLFQGVLRNPLADPSVIGVTSGAGVGAMLILYVFPALSAAWIPLGAIIGSFIAVVIVLLLSKKMHFQPAVMALMGIGISAVGSAIIQILIVRFNLNAASALTWLSGSTYARGFDELQWFLIGPLLVIVPIAFYFMKQIDLLALGEETSIGVGMNVTLLRWSMSILATVIAACSVAAAGTIGFVGLVAPHIARMIVGHDNRKIFPLSMLIGGGFLVWADALGRLVLAPKEIPSGIVVAMIGAPFLLWLMRKRKV
ncbi:iron ABC transporter permease [Salipaludibacillus sp. CF4.18]|uniref:iron ABC transporter permease n=1 Tax=Salipaludibacillus sp. CF4.18 TaxID=3373081 RepID=UPI003EE70AA4